MICRKTELEDWAAVQACFQHLRNSRHALRLGGEEPILRAYFIHALTDQRLFLPALFDEQGTVHGFSLMQDSLMPCPTADGTAMELNAHAFIRAIYVKAGVKQADAQLLDDLMTAWSMSKNHVFMCGNCRPDFPPRFAQRYGYEVSSVIVKKTLREA